MLVLDSDFVVEYLNPSREHHEAAVAFVEETREEPVGAPTPVLYELARHEARTEYGPTVDEFLSGVAWADPLEFTVDAVREAAFVDAELAERGERIPQFDVLIAGIARSVGGTVVSRDDHYDRVEGLQRVSYA